MIATAKRPEAPTDDKRWRIVETTMRRHGYSRNALIETLHSVQDGFGFLDLPSLRFVAASLHVPLSAVFGVATFYQHSCIICTGTACYIKRATELLEHIKHTYGIGDGETTEDQKVSLLTARCLGTCSMAPAAVFDGEIKGEVTETDIDKRLEGWKAS